MYDKELQMLGLSEKEAKVYLTSLSIGSETAQNIAKHSGINRATTYVQIESLRNKGLMTEFEKGKKTYYSAETPERLLGLIATMEKQVELKRAELNRIMPSLSNIFLGAGNRPKVRFFEGFEGIQNIQEEFLKVKNKKIESFTNLDQLMGSYPNVKNNYSDRRIEKKITGYILYTSENGAVMKNYDAEKLRHARWLPKSPFPVSADISIFDDNISIATYKEKYTGVIINDAEMAQTLRALFYALWDRL